MYWQDTGTGYDESGNAVPTCGPVYPDDEPVAPAQAEQAVANFWQWLTDPRLAAVFGGERFERKARVLAWVVDPNGHGKSLSELAEELGVSKQAASRTAAQISRTLGIRNVWQRGHGHRFNRRVGQP